MSNQNYAKMTSLALIRGKLIPVTIEVSCQPGIGIHMVGLCDAAVKETLLRTVTALSSSGFSLPGKKITINIVPADLHKHVSGIDLALALCILAASGQVPSDSLEGHAAFGSLGLDGSVRGCGTVPTDSVLLTTAGVRRCIVPEESSIQLKDISLTKVGTLREAVNTMQEQAE